MHEYFHSKNLYYDGQYGFRKKHSTELAAIEMIDRITQELDKGNTPFNIFLDLSKAFDTLDHEIMLYKLKYYGVRGPSLKLLKSYLSDRKQYVEFENVKSNKNTIKTGVPQGSILGPLLFVIYVNDISLASKIFTSIIYADDTTLSSTLNVFQFNNNLNINNELSKVSEWLKVNKLSLNIKKTKMMIYHMPQKIVTPPKVEINGTSIECVSSFNYLGITIDKHLNWQHHINSIANKISKYIGILNKLKKMLPLKTLLLMYNYFILSSLNYGILVWGYNTDRLFKLQKRAIRVISKSKFNAHTDPLFKKLHILKIKDLHKLHVLKFHYKLLHKTVPHYFDTNMTLTQHSHVHSYPTRNNKKLRAPKIHHEFARKCIRYSIIQTVNDCPICITEKIYTHSLHGFASYVKYYMLKQYETSCDIENCYTCQK